MILVIDNYDSFTYNLVQYLSEWEKDIRVFRNNRITADEIARLAPDALIISPGPGDPAQAGVSLEVIRRFAGKIPILGVCLGHQCIGEAFGGRIVRAARLMHGKTSPVMHDGKGVFRGLPNPFDATRYHSLLIEKQSMPRDLVVSAWTKEGEIMGVRHVRWPVEGVQFHPESILTADGKKLLRNFIDACARRGRAGRKRP